MMRPIHSLPLINVLAVIILLSGCKKEGENSAVNNSGAARINITLAGVATAESIEAAAAGSGAQATGGIIKKSQVAAWQTGAGADSPIAAPADVSVNITQQGIDDYAAQQAAVHGSSAKMAAVNNQMAAVTPMVPGIKYRVFIFKADGSTLAVRDGSAGTNITPVPVEPGKAYSWAAYTYNTADVLPALADTLNPQFDISTAKDFYVARGTINSAVNGDNAAPLTFKPGLAQFRLVLDTRGTFSTVLSGEFSLWPESTYYTTATFSLKDGTLTNKGGAGDFYYVGRFNGGGALQPVNPATTKDSLLHYMLKTIPGPLTMLDTATFTVSADHPTSNQYTDGVRYNFGLRPAKILNLTAGNITTVTCILIAKSSKIGNTWWSTGNLYFDSANPGYRMRIDPKYDYSASRQANGGEYWLYNQLYPYQSGKTGTGDPCAQVYPKGKWRMPTSAELADVLTYFSGVQGQEEKFTNVNTAANVYALNYTGNGRQSAHFPNNGSFKTHGRLLNGIIDNYSGTNNTAKVCFWGVGAGGNAGIFDLYYNTATNDITGNAQDVAPATVQNEARNVRCVRDL